MSALLLDAERMPRKKKSDEGLPPRDDITVKLDAGLVRLAKSVAAFRGQWLAEYLSDALRPIVTRDFNEMHKVHKAKE